jgi:tagatose-6-phosphate ketose/aldose isomerase
VTAVPAGTLLTHPDSHLPQEGPFLLVSLARSGDSPESRAIVDWALRRRPEARHVVLTCNREGALATAYHAVPAVRAVVLDESTNDRSLVMTSSFTNLVLAARALGGAAADGHEGLALSVAGLLREGAGELARTAREGFSSVIALGSGSRLGSAREAALKMLEMNAGAVWTLAETFLGLRHGPMSAVSDDTLVLAFLSCDPHVRAYELDVLRELDRKQLGSARVLVGAGLPEPRPDERRTVRVECGGAAGCDEPELAALDAVAGQLLAFFRCLHAGRRPDAPSEDGVITRVVSEFQIHSRDGRP